MKEPERIRWGLLVFYLYCVAFLYVFWWAVFKGIRYLWTGSW